MIDGALEGQSMCTITQQECTNNNSIFQVYFTIGARLRISNDFLIARGWASRQPYTHKVQSVQKGCVVVICEGGASFTW